MEKPITQATALRIFRMIPTDGFIALFWDEIKTANHSGTHITHREAFEKLNEEYFSVTGIYRYSSFESFKKIKDKT